MKSLLAIFVLVSLLAFAHCFPGIPGYIEDVETDEKPSNPHLVELIYPESKNFDNDRETGIFPFNFNIRPIRFGFNTGFGSMKDLMKMMTDLFNDVPSFDDTKSWSKIPEGANTTSVTNVVGGNVVTVNETTYTDNNDNGGTFIRFRTIHIKPENETLGGAGNDDVGGGEEIEETTNHRSPETSAKEETTPSRSVETVEDFGNEIPRSQGDVLQA